MGFGDEDKTIVLFGKDKIPAIKADAQSANKYHNDRLSSNRKTFLDRTNSTKIFTGTFSHSKFNGNY
jgi:hypothetical protein